MDLVSEIKRIEQSTGKRDRISSEERWTEARHVWTVVNSGTSRLVLSERVGCSATHIRYLYNAWDRVGQKLSVCGPEALPTFYDVYNSAEVRGPEQQEEKPMPDPEPSPRQTLQRKNPRNPDNEPRPTPRETAEVWIATADSALDKLLTFPGFWPLISETDTATLLGMVAKVRKIVSGIERERLTKR